MPQSSSPSRNPVRTSVARLVPHLRHVTIDATAIDATAAELATDEFELPAWRAPVFPDERTQGTTAADVVDFLFVGNAINFAFRDFETGENFRATYDGEEYAGAFAMWACLQRALDAGEPVLSGSYLRDLTLTDVQTLFEPATEVEIPMLEARHRILTAVGERLVTEFDGRFHTLVDRSSNRLYDDGSGIVGLLVEHFPSFDDAYPAQCGDEILEVCFYKRAQLAAAMMHGRFPDDGRWAIRDEAAFTIFADYNLPNVLRSLGILEYSPDLRARIDDGELLVEGSREELELRAATIHAADQLMDAINEQRDRPIYGPHLDAKLFFMRDSVETPVHVTETTAY